MTWLSEYDSSKEIRIVEVNMILQLRQTMFLIIFKIFKFAFILGFS